MRYAITFSLPFCIMCFLLMSAVSCMAMEPEVIAVAAGHGHSVALKDDGTVWCWGSNGYGQLGDGTRIDRYAPVQVSYYDYMNKVSFLTDIRAVAAGNSFTMVIKNDGTVWGWGNNRYGQLGDGTCVESDVPVQVAGLTSVRDIVVMNESVIALKYDGTVWTWGYNFLGKAVDAKNESLKGPVMIEDLDLINSIAAGSHHLLAANKMRGVYALGQNKEGQLGDGTTLNSIDPVSVTDLLAADSLSAGYTCSLALDKNGQVWAWGSNAQVQPGNDSTERSLTPVKISGLDNVKLIASGGSYSVAVKRDGSVWAWGNNEYGQLGNGELSNVPVSAPSMIYGLYNVKMISAGPSHCLALRDDGSVLAWGNNQYGQLGDSGREDKYTPVLSKISPANAVPLPTPTIVPTPTATPTPSPTVTPTPPPDNDNMNGIIILVGSSIFMLAIVAYFLLRSKI
ncbi:RCC1 repeat- and reductase domain-containing protein [Methanocella sp. CWC-04]|uniref:RCC1 repeat- and reductase domain-containing protein n=2 Tax=Methanooceanicella nereidis TaxID=2052831 RepID=A0AAP2RCQ6_9EURY|nr:RCC1 repeat- and reductase domain-containing protein [Methanocella sp. CWC-04]